jgi:hypothetical protein
VEREGDLAAVHLDQFVHERQSDTRALVRPRLHPRDAMEALE